LNFADSAINKDFQVFLITGHESHISVFTMDYLSLKAAVAEAEKKLSGLKVTNAWQAGSVEVALAFKGGPGVILSVDPVRSGLFLIEPERLPKRSSSAFSDLLRARVKGSTLGSIHLALPGERVLFMYFAAAWPDRAGAHLTLTFEDMGRRSNLALLEEERVLQPLRTVSKEKSPARPLVAGERYQLPPAREAIPLEELTPEALSRSGSLDDTKSLLKAVGGLSPHCARQVLLKTRLGPSGGEPESWAVLEAIGEMMASCTGHEGFLHYAGKKIHLSPFEPILASELDRVERFSPFSAAAQAWRDIREAGPEHDGGVIPSLEHDLREKIKSLHSAMESVLAQEKRCLAHNEIRVMAEALLINANTVKPGSESATFPDSYDQGLEITVPLDPAKNPQENANDLFSSARRLKRGLEEVVRRRSDIEEQTAEVLEAIKALEDRNDPEPALRLLGSPAQGIPKGDRERQTVYGGPGRRHLVEGFTVLVGKSSTDNEKVTFQAAGPNDLWLHARDYPGSHAVILTGKRNVPDTVLYEAAALAAAGSGAKNDTAPEVMVTQRKWVRKLKGGKPGQVTVERYRTIRPRMDRPKANTQGSKGKTKN